MKGKIWLILGIIDTIITVILAPRLEGVILFTLICTDIIFFIGFFISLSQKRKQEKIDEKLGFQNELITNTNTEIKNNSSLGNNENLPKNIIENIVPNDILQPPATIVVKFYKDKMGFGALPIRVNKKHIGTIEKGTTVVTYETNVPYNVVSCSDIPGALNSINEITLSAGDKIEYVVAGNGFHNDKTVITKNNK
jgi:hypothetical protein